MEVKKDNTDRRTPSANTISKKHGTPLARLRKQLAMGAKIEREHTHSDSKAREIARDHLAEIPDYYTRLKKMEREAGVKEAYVDPLEAMHNATRARILKGAKEGKYWLLRSEDIDMGITEAAEYAHSWKNLRPKLQNAAYSGVVAGVPAVAGYIAARKNRNNLKTAAAAVGATSGASQAFRQSQVTKWGKDLNSWEKAFTSKPGGSVTFTDPRTGGRYSSAAPLIRTTREHQATIGAGRDVALGAGGYALGSFLGSRAARKKRMTESERSHLISHIIETVTTGSIGSYNKPLGVDSRDITMGRRNRWTRDELAATVQQLLNKRSRPMPTP